MNKVAKLMDALHNAENYNQWKEIAQAIDRKSGAERWIQSAESDIFNYQLLQTHLKEIKGARNRGDYKRVLALLVESLYRHLNEITHPALYAQALSGTKSIVKNYLDEVCAIIEHLVSTDIPGLPPQIKLEKIEQAYRNYGRTALVLSGGAAFGIYHLGVAKAIWEQGLMPGIISGSSMGAIVAAGLCSRSDDELDDFFAHPERINRIALKPARMSVAVRTGYLMDASVLYHHILDNVGDFTFAEAFSHSGRTLSITVSPTRAYQKPRILSHQTTPDVLVPQSVLASCAIPGIFPPVRLKERASSGQLSDYMATEQWIDGSVQSDIPLLRMSRLFNVNHTIVSQANPHVLPFISHKNTKGPWAFTKHIASSMIHAQSAELLEIARDVAGNSSWRPLLDKAYGLARQSYLGDINISFPFHLKHYRKVASNPSEQDLANYIRMGEQATWPHIEAIKDQTRIGRLLETSLQALRKQVRAEHRESAI